jgi:hypothetical protein
MKKHNVILRMFSNRYFRSFFIHKKYVLMYSVMLNYAEYFFGMRLERRVSFRKYEYFMNQQLLKGTTILFYSYNFGLWEKKKGKDE